MEAIPRAISEQPSTMGGGPGLPWEWFDFLRPPRPVDRRIADTVDEGAADHAWRVTVDNQLVPFKLLRRKPANGRSRPMLVMLHGMGLTIATFRGVAGYLFETHDLALIDYSTLSSITWDPPSPPDGWPQGGVAIKVMAEAVWAVADAIGVEVIDLAGNSLGGGMCLVAAIQKPARVRRMVLANPACYPQELPRMYRLARVPLLGELLMAATRPEKLIGGLEHIGYVDKARFVPELRARYLKCMDRRRNRFRLMEMIRHLPHGATDVTVALHLQQLKEITQPVMLVWGEQDPLLVQGAGQRLAADLPNCTFRLYPDLAHMPHEEAPDRVGPEWSRFLNDQ
jgi:pimeloyl-ACP methyl ester carboxylesterase